MDLHTITAVRRPASRAELALGPGEAVLAGGTWLFSEPQPDLHTGVDLRDLAWPPLDTTGSGLTIAATCTLRQLAAFRSPHSWPVPLLPQCCEALAASFTICRGPPSAGTSVWDCRRPDDRTSPACWPKRSGPSCDEIRP